MISLWLMSLHGLQGAGDWWDLHSYIQFSPSQARQFFPLPGYYKKPTLTAVRHLMNYIILLLFVLLWVHSSPVFSYTCITPDSLHALCLCSTQPCCVGLLSTRAKPINNNKMWQKHGVLPRYKLLVAGRISLGMLQN